MIGLGTLVDVIAVIVSALIGCVCQKFINERIQKTIMQTLGLSVILIGFTGAVTDVVVVKSNGHLATIDLMMVIVSMALGGLIGEAINIDKGITTFAIWIKKIVDRNGKGKDSSKFVEGFIAATMTTCIGAMLIVGALKEGLSGNHTLLFTKSILDSVTIILYSAAYGLGPLFAFIPILILQGGLTFLAVYLHSFITPAILTAISAVGNLLIVGVGLNVLTNLHLRVANMLPALIIAILYVVYI